MFNQLEMDHSLYIIGQKQLAYFKQLAENWQVDLHNVNPKCLNEMDTWAIVLNSWLFLKSKHNNLIIHPSKAIYYSINIFLIKELEKCPVIHRLTQINDDDLLYITAFQLSNSLGHWVYNLLNNNDTDDVLHRNIQLEYFLAHQNNGFTATNAIFHMDQTRAIKKIAHAVRTKNCFTVTVHNAVYQALDIYNTHSSPSNHA